MWLCAAPVAWSQTPWETAPAKPAELTADGNRYMGASVKALPLPPPRTGYLTTAWPSLPPRLQVNSHTPQGVTTQLPAFPNLPLPDLTSASPALSAKPQAILTSASNTASTTNFDNGTLVAVIGSDHVLAGDLAEYVEPVVEQNRDRIRSSADEQRLREMVIRQALKHYVHIKALHQEFFRDASGSSNPEKIDDLRREVTTRAGKVFFEQQVPVMLKKYQAESLPQLEAKLREKSMSLSTMKSMFIEQVLAMELERKYVPNHYDITRAELIAYYQDNQEDWDEPAKAQWKQLTVRFDKHQHDRAAVDALIKQLGNQVYFGQPFETVAQQSSEDLMASQGGHYDWTRKGSLKSKPLEDAIFSIPLGLMSKVITDDVGMHIVVVIERTEARTTNFTDAQADIREKLSEAKRLEEVAKFRAKVLSRTPVWSRWPDDLRTEIPHVRPLEEALEPTLAP